MDSGPSYGNLLSLFRAPGELLVRLEDGSGGGPVMREGSEAECSYCLRCGTIVMVAPIPLSVKKSIRPGAEW
ncbi:MAG: hypothetical protein JWO82_3168 [Akkermansiaceae bacterium]|nr:hypothetical protein [Akkermansiaceae bacterium]